MQKSREDTDVLNAKGFRGTWKTTAQTAAQEWMVRVMSDMAMKYEDWLRGCVHHDGRKGNVYLPCDRVLAIADWIEAHRDVAPVRHGRWEDEFKEDAEAFVKHRYVCTVCGNWQTYGKTAYCPNCGAKMDEGGSNGTDNK